MVDLPAPFSPTRAWTSPCAGKVHVGQRLDAGKSLVYFFRTKMSSVGCMSFLHSVAARWDSQKEALRSTGGLLPARAPWTLLPCCVAKTGPLLAHDLLAGREPSAQYTPADIGCFCSTVSPPIRVFR